MKCVVRVRDRTDIEVFVPKKMTAEDLLQDLYEKEIVRTAGLKSVVGHSDMKHISVEGSWGHTDFYIRTLVEVEE